MSISDTLPAKKNDKHFTNVPINQTYFGFYVNVKIIDDTEEDPVSIPMQLALYTSNTLLAAKGYQCQDFYTYDCDSFFCNDYPSSSVTNEYPYFTAKGHFISPNFYLQTSAWNLSINATYATDCHKGRSQYGTGTYGLLGLGVDDKSWENFLGLYPIFSIYIDENTTSGFLYFQTNWGRAASETPAAVLPADNNWHVSNVNFIEFGSVNVSMSAKMIFDMNMECIGIPLAQYPDILNAITNNITGLTCPTGQDSYYRPSCNYTNGFNISNLPNLTIYIGNQKLDIPPQVYIEVVRNHTNTTGSIRLSMKAIDNTLADNNYVSPIYNKYVILDSYTMSFYYTVFDGVSHSTGNSVIKLYYSDHSIKKQSDKFVLYLTLTISCLMLVIVAILIYLRCVKAQKQAERRKKHPNPKKRLLRSPRDFRRASRNENTHPHPPINVINHADSELESPLHNNSAP